MGPPIKIGGYWACGRATAYAVAVAILLVVFALIIDPSAKADGRHEVPPSPRIHSLGYSKWVLDYGDGLRAAPLAFARKLDITLYKVKARGVVEKRYHRLRSNTIQYLLWRAVPPTGEGTI